MVTRPQILETSRLTLRPFEVGDAAFVLALVNEPGWLRYIGDKGIHDLTAAVRYIEEGPHAMYRTFGFGALVVTLRESGEAIGMCGLIKRDWLDDVDLGFAVLTRWQGRGFAQEAATAVLADARLTYGLTRVIAITSPENIPSGRLLQKLGFRFERQMPLGPKSEELKVYGCAW